ncbi:MAG: hypothetical protein ACOCRX_08015 [Candidatus Woesearchaeota archaeon]
MRYFLYNIENEQGILIVSDNKTAKGIKNDDRTKELSSKNIENVYILDPDDKVLYSIKEIEEIMVKRNLKNSFLPTGKTAQSI